MNKFTRALRRAKMASGGDIDGQQDNIGLGIPYTQMQPSVMDRLADATQPIRDFSDQTGNTKFWRDVIAGNNDGIALATGLLGPKAGARMMPNKAFNQKGYPMGSYTDPDGWSAHVIYDRTNLTPQDLAREQAGKPAGSGYMVLEDPQGNWLPHGGWMNFPEPGWKWNGIDLDRDYWATKPGQSVWEKQVPLQWRLDMEAKQQGTAYDPLAKQWNWRMKNHNTNNPLYDLWTKSNSK